MKNCRMMLVLVVSLAGCVAEPFGFTEQPDPGVLDPVAAASADRVLIAPRVGLCEGREVLCTVPSLRVVMGVTAHGDTVPWQLAWEAPALDIPDSLAWRYKFEFDGTHHLLDGRTTGVVPGGGGLFAGREAGDLESTPRNRMTCDWAHILDVARSVTVRPELVNPEIDSRFAHRDDRGGRTRVSFPASKVEQDAGGQLPHCGAGEGGYELSDLDVAKATEYLDYVPPPDTADTSNPDNGGSPGSPPDTTSSTTNATPPPTDRDGIPRIPIDLQVAVCRGGDFSDDCAGGSLVSDIQRGDVMRFSVASMFSDGTNAEGQPIKWCWGAYPYGWYVTANYRPWVAGTEIEGVSSAGGVQEQSSSCWLDLEGIPRERGDREVIPYTFDYAVPDNAFDVPGEPCTEIQRAHGLCSGTWVPGLEPRPGASKVRCLAVNFTIWSQNGSDYRRYVVNEMLPVGPADPENWSGSC